MSQDNQEEVENYQDEDYYQEGDFEGNLEEEEEENNQDDDWDYGQSQDTGTPVLIIDDDDGYDVKLALLQSIENNFSALMYGIDINLFPDRSFELKIPRTFLPLTLQVAYGFMQHDIAFIVKVFYEDEWNSPYSKAYVTHPISGQIYTGSVLVKDSLSKFFNKDYKPKTYYRSAPFFFYSSTNPDMSKVPLITKEGFTEAQAKRTLSLCRNNVHDSLVFLRTGQINMSEHLDDAKPPVSYKENPLIYLVLEIADSIFDIQDHCSICREPISPGIKPATCERESCKYTFSNIGVGISLIQEIKRDIKVADLLYTSFLCALDTDFLTPAPPNFKISDIKKIVKNMPQFSQIIAYPDDLALSDAIGISAFNLLRWIILSNRSQLFYLPPKIQLDFISSGNCFQYMALISSPDQEDIFQQLKKKYGSTFAWHGSPTDRWHSIIRNGLINASNTKLMRCGAAYGPGIYLGKSSQISLGYSVGGPNPFKASTLGRNFSVIALCEVIKLPNKKEVTEKVYYRDPINGNRCQKNIKGALNDFDSIFTLTMEEACIVRFVVVNLQKCVDVCSSPPKLPTLVEVLEAHSEAHI